MTQRPTIILASGSAVRARLLEGARIPFERIPSKVDESILKAELETDGADAGEHGAGPAIARALAEAKAKDVSKDHPDALVIGADQVLTLGRDSFDKPRDMDEARERLKQFRARGHVLHSGVALVRGGETIWTHYEASHLVMRDFSDGFLDAYLTACGEAVLTSVGAYQLEGMGAQLFEKIDGDYFAILGLPLIPLMDELRKQGALLP